MVVFLIVLFFAATSLMAQERPPIIPLPETYQKIQGMFALNQQTAIVVNDASFEDEAYFLQKELLRYKGIAISVQPKKNSTAIILERSRKKQSNNDAYSVKMDTASVIISSATDEGLFYGIISFLQLVASAEIKKDLFLVACWNLEDAPLYQWRGLMLDESRHFFGKEKVKSLLDWMAFYKLNRFHWHLTDEPAWRLEIKKYPKLALVGGIGNYLDSTAPSNYYRQEDIQEIVAYAAERKILIVPEIDMPGHATAANKAYPQFSGGGSLKHPEFTFNPGKEATYQYLTDVLRETDVLFPPNMIHLGGDEVSYGNEKWKADSEVQNLMTVHKLKDLKAVEEYFMQRMADSLFKMNNKFLAWDEMADVLLPVEKTIIFWWRQDQPQQLQKALEKGYSVVLCPRLPFYFDFVQDSIHRFGRKWDKLYNDLKNVYSFSAEQIPAMQYKKQLIAGIQANLWTETVSNEQRLDYLLFPRIIALAEAAWSSQKNFPDFLNRLKGHLPLFEKQKIYYYNPFYPAQHPEPVVLK